MELARELSKSSYNMTSLVDEALAAFEALGVMDPGIEQQRAFQEAQRKLDQIKSLAGMPFLATGSIGRKYTEQELSVATNVSLLIANTLCWCSCTCSWCKRYIVL
jgi:hypothetical protein